MDEIQTLKRAKLNDVAKRAGVSASTVSLVLAGRSPAYRISEATQERVRQASADLNYSPSLLHRSARCGKTGILSFYNSFRNRESGDLYMDRLSAAIEHAGGRKGYNVLVHCDFNQTEAETYDFLNGGFADGLILFAPSPRDPLYLKLKTSALPTVIFSPRELEPALSSVRDDSEHGVSLVANALVSRGHRQICIVSQDSTDWPDPKMREELLRKYLADRGVSPEHIRTVVTTYDSASDLREILSPPKPTAVFAWNDRTAYDLLAACQDAGVRVPQDLSIVGYDGIRWPSETNQEVTSVRTPLEDMADAAVDILNQLISGHGGQQHERIAGDLTAGSTLADLTGS